MVMVSPALNPTACWEFEGEILVLHHPTTISSRYQAMGKFLNYYLCDARSSTAMGGLRRKRTD